MKFILVMLLATNTALADIKSAIKDYENREFKKAYAEFELLSQFGYSTIHHYLAKMLMNGEGVDENLIQAYAWSKF